MKQKALKIGTTLLLGITVLVALLTSALFTLNATQSASAVEGTITSSVAVEEDDEVLAGDTVTLTATASSTLGSAYFWGAVTLIFRITDDDGNNIDPSYIENLEVLDFEGDFSDCVNNTVQETLEEGGISHSTIRFALLNNALNESLTMDKPCTMKVRFKLAEGTPGGTKIKFQIDDYFKQETQVKYYSVSGYDENTVDTDSNADMFVIDSSATITVREKSSDNTLSALKVGTTENNAISYPKEGETAVADSINYDYAESAVLSSINITPTAANEYATVYMAAGSTAPEQTEANLVESGKEKNIALTSEIRTVTILVKAESGDTKTYTVTIVDKYVALSDLVIEVGTKTEGVTKIGLGEGVAFDPETLTYTVDVPSDYASSETGVKITPTIAEGHGIQATVALAGTNSSPENNSVASGSSVQVTGIANDGSLTLTATASDGVTAKAYIITFKLWSVETGTIDFKVKGEREAPYESDAEKAAEKKIDYYFLLTDEAECKGKFLITPSVTDISIQIQPFGGTAEKYDATKEYGAGTYSIILTADAGNTKQYVASLSKMEYLELAAESTFQFIFEETTGTGARAKSYLRTYHEKGMTHGVDDKQFEKVVLGNIAPKTTINMFLANVSPSQRNMIRIYNNKDRLLYDCGADIEGIDKANYDKWSKYRISTSWYVQYGGTAENPLETVYISVLGDTSCNGTIDSADSVKMSAHISKKKLITDLEVRLAGYVTNGGSIASKDITKLNRIITLKDKIEDCLYKPAENATGA